jgi:hypothetical protein
VTTSWRIKKEGRLWVARIDGDKVASAKSLRKLEQVLRIGTLMREVSR